MGTRETPGIKDGEENKAKSTNERSQHCQGAQYRFASAYMGH